MNTFDMTGARFEEAFYLDKRADSALFRTSMPSGKDVPLHSHIDPEGFYVLSGSIEVFLLNENPGWQTVSAGASLLIEDGIKHAVRNHSGESAELMVITNRRLADYFHQVGRPAEKTAQLSAPTKEDLQRMLAVGKDFGYWFASPEESQSVTG